MNAHDLLTKAKTEKYALGAFNAGNLEIVSAIVQAAKAQQAPIIIEASSGEISHFGLKNFLSVLENFRLESGLSILSNLDHGPGLEECQQAIAAGFNLVHFDGSDLPYEENVKITKAVVEAAHAKGILVEGEINKIIGSSAPHPQESAESVAATGNYTDPVQAEDFAHRTGVDILASFVGNVHGTYQTEKKLDLERLRLISQAVPCFLSLHGGSKLTEADIQGAIKLGVVKINVNTELRIALRNTLENVLKGSDEVAVYKIMTPAIAAMADVVEEKIQLFGSANKLSDRAIPSLEPDLPAKQAGILKKIE